MIVLLEPTRPAGFLSGTYRFHDEVTRRLAAKGQGWRVAIEPAELEQTVRSLREEPESTLVVDGAFAELTGRPLPAGAIALLHADPMHSPWCQQPMPVIATSGRVADHVRAQVRSVTTIRPGIDACFVPPEHAPRNERPRIVCVGTVCSDKGQHLVVESVADEGICELVFVGDTQQEPAYVAALREEAEDTPITFTGCLPPEGVAAELQRADLFVSTSRDASFALAGSEAAACGTPVLAFDVGEIDTFVRHEETGWLLAPDADDSVVSRWILDLIGERERLNEARRQPGPTLLRSWDEVAREFVDAISAPAS